MPFRVSIKYILHWNQWKEKCSVSRADRCFPSLPLRRASQKATGLHWLTLLIASRYNLLLSQSKLFTPLSSVVDSVVGVECGLNHHYHLPAPFCAPSDKTAPIRDCSIPPLLSDRWNGKEVRNYVSSQASDWCWFCLSDSRLPLWNKK